MAIGDTINSFSAPGSSCNGVVWDGSSLWVNDTSTDKLYQINTEDGSVISESDLPTDSSSQISRGMAWDGTHIWYVDDGNDKIRKIQTDGTEIGAFSAPAIQPSGIVWAGSDLWVSSVNTRTVYRVDSSDGSVLESVDLDSLVAGINPTGLTFAVGSIWVADGDQLHQMSEDKASVTRSIELGFSGALGISHDQTGRFWVATLTTVYAVEGPVEPPTIQQQFEASYADVSGRDPLATALTQRTPAQNLVDYLVSLYAGTNPRIVTKQVQIELGELDKTSPAPATGDLSRQIWIEDDRDPNFAGGRWATILGRSGGSDPGTVELVLFIADNPESFVEPT